MSIKIRGRGLWERIDEYAMGILVAVAMLGAAHFGGGPLAQHEPQLPGIFEGQGAVTVGCALWDVPITGEDYTGDSKDFVVSGDRDSLIMLYSFGGKTRLISGSQCGYSVDHRVFPDKEREHDRSASASGSSANR